MLELQDRLRQLQFREGVAALRAEVLNARGEHGIVRRSERQLVDHHHGECPAAHVDAFPEGLAAEEHRVAERAKARQQLAARSRPLHEKRKTDPLAQQLVRAPQRPQRGKEQERAPSTRLENGQRRLDHRFCECGVVRVERQALGNIEQRLVREVERACPAARLGFGHAELAGEMLEVLADGQGGRSEDPGARVVHHLPPEQLRARKRRDVQLGRVSVDFHPAHLGLAFALAHARKNRHRAARSACAGGQPL